MVTKLRNAISIAHVTLQLYAYYCMNISGCLRPNHDEWVFETFCVGIVFSADDPCFGPDTYTLCVGILLAFGCLIDGMLHLYFDV